VFHVEVMRESRMLWDKRMVNALSVICNTQCCKEMAVDCTACDRKSGGRGLNRGFGCMQTL
jgi:hypothetical protein